MNIDPPNLTTVILSALGGAVGGIITYMLSKVTADWAAQRVFSPRLLLSFDPGPHAKGFIVDSETIIYEPHPTYDDLKATRPMGYSMKYVRVRVHNARNRMASNCMPYLVGVQKQNEHGRFVDTSYCDSIPLCWSYSNPDSPTAISIPNGVNLHFDVFHTMITKGHLQPCLVTYPNAYHDLVSEKGVYLLKLMVTADGIPPSTIDLRVEWNCMWDEFKVSQYAG